MNIATHKPFKDARANAAIVLGELGNLQVRLATGPGERAAAQRLRYDVFFSEMGVGISDPAVREARDEDTFDTVCDHLIVLDNSLPGDTSEYIVGTYRLLRDDAAACATGFYSSGEYQVGPFVARHPGKRFLELGRSCVLPSYRTKRTIELLWQGIWAYCLQHRIDVMFGCASFAGCVPAAHALALSFLHCHAAAGDTWNVDPACANAWPLDMVPVEAVDRRMALLSMPPLIKGYLRLGAKFAETAVVDTAFGTTDVMVVLPVEDISDRYVRYYGADAGRYSPVA